MTGINIANIVSAGIFAVILVMATFFRGIEQTLYAPIMGGCAAIALLSVLPRLARADAKAGWPLPWPPLTVAVLLFYGWIVLALPRAESMFLSTAFTIIFLSVPVLFFAIASGPDRGATRAMIRIFMGVVVALSVWAVVQAIFLYNISGGRIHHPFLNANDLGAFVAMGVPLFLSMMLYAPKRRAILAAVFMILAVCAICMTQSRGGFLAAGGAIVLVLGVALPVARQKWRFLLLTALAAAVFATAVQFSTGNETTLLSRFGTIGTDYNASVNERFLLWNAGAAMAAERPLLGVGGLASFYLLYAARRDLNDYSDGFFVHLDPLQMAAETGIPALIFFYIVMGVIFVRMWSALAGAAVDPAARMRAMAPFAAMAVLVVNAHLSFQLYMPVFLIPAGVLLAEWARRCDDVLGPGAWVLPVPDKRAVRAAVMAGLAVAVLIPGSWAVRAGAAIHYTELATRVMNGGDLDRADAMLNRADVFAPESYPRIDYVRGVVYRLRLARNPHDADTRREYFTRALAHFEAAEALNPYNAYYLNEHAMLYYGMSKSLEPQGVEKARQMLERAASIDPLNFNVNMGLAAVYESMGRPHDAIAAMERPMQWGVARDYAPPQILQRMVGLYASVGNTEKAEFYREKIEYRRIQQKARITSMDGIDQWIATRINALREWFR